MLLLLKLFFSELFSSKNMPSTSNESLEKDLLDVPTTFKDCDDVPKL
jgi:hypothetical protein